MKLMPTSHPPRQMNYYMAPLMKTVTEIAQSRSVRPIALTSGFIRKFEMCFTHTRDRLLMHVDRNELTISMALTNRTQIRGGRFFIFSEDMTSDLLKIYPRHNVEDVPLLLANIERFMMNNKWRLPYLDMDAGDAIFYRGENRFHGVMPVQSGVRYTIVFFFNTVEAVYKEACQSGIQKACDFEPTMEYY